MSLLAFCILHLQVVALFPRDKFWAKNETLISTPEKVYNLANIREFFSDINYDEGWEFYQDTKNLVYDLTPPRVKVCRTDLR